MLSRMAISLALTTILAAQSSPETHARQAMKEFMDAFNSRDPQKWAASLNYPHVRLASNNVRVYNSAEEFARESKDYAQRLAPWDHSTWESMEMIQSG